MVQRNYHEFVTMYSQFRITLVQNELQIELLRL